MDIFLKTGDLKRLVYNAKLYADRRSDAKGTTLWIISDQTLRVVSSDDFVILVDEALADSKDGICSPSAFELTLAELKDLWETIKDQPDDSSHYFSNYDELPFTPEGKVLNEYHELVTQDFGPAPYISSFAVWPDRFKKMALIKPGGAPLAFQWVTTETLTPVLLFKAGKTAFGMIIPLDEEYLRSSDEFEGMLW